MLKKMNWDYNRTNCISKYFYLGLSQLFKNKKNKR